ncbi:RNA-binding domain-containing protein [Rhizodiscina lignyota]|uniref:RNA-binding domain-containing protein n=1 Tax=Rhizodiscina lignyota TaxID=1504668 RepID=A0A9P4IFK8_9PEZI|nr:RNA-binding domain-containing protein [Rhizodiscina lignyota]
MASKEAPSKDATAKSGAPAAKAPKDPKVPLDLSTPSQTLYISNLNEKLNKETMKKALYMAFSHYGAVLDIVNLKTMKMRGQAHITFRDIETATSALRDMQGFNFYEKNMVIGYAKGKANFVAKHDGTLPYTGYSARASAQEQSSDSNQNIFNAPPPVPTGTMIENGATDEEMTDGSKALMTLPDANGESSRGAKRARDGGEGRAGVKKAKVGGLEEEDDGVQASAKTIKGKEKLAETSMEEDDEEDDEGEAAMEESDED